MKRGEEGLVKAVLGLSRARGRPKVTMEQMVRTGKATCRLDGTLGKKGLKGCNSSTQPNLPLVGQEFELGHDTVSNEGKAEKCPRGKVADSFVGLL